ncbi:cubilin-like isoform X2 [Apostichopus japonicus]|uniref:cubilin-like isoform X2 n=1 Tax=Stichopus japonicus TaxID=307972 RepID=UPI003AB67966
MKYQINFSSPFLFLFFLGGKLLMAQACDVTLSNSSGTLTSPEYPNLYPSNLNCTWHLQAAEGKVIELTFDDVQLEAKIGGQCYDTITIADPTPGSESLPATFCDDGPGWPAHPIRFLSTTNQLTIHMQTDNTLEERGFSARYNQVQPRTEYIAAIGTDIASIVRFDRFSKKGFQNLPLPGSTHPFALTFDPISAYFYYTDIHEKFIARVNIKGDIHDILVDDHIDTPSGIAVAYITGLMYWADTRRNEVSVSRLDGTSRKYISPPDSGCETPRAVALSLDHRSVFWNCRRSLKRSKADGSELVVLVDGLNDVKTLQIDPYYNVLYWINALGETANLERINLNGTDRQRVYSNPVLAASNGFTMDMFALFWSINASIHHVEIGGNSIGSITLVNDPPALEGLFYYRSDEEISAQHQCAIDNGQCSELCFPEGVSFVCVGVKPLVSNCPDGVQMYTQGPQQIPWQEPTAVSRTYGEQTPVALPFRSRTHIPGSTFNLGLTTVVYIFEDDLGNEAKCSFSIELSPITTTNEACNVTLSNSTGTFTSPEYPNLYPSNLNCTWHLQAAEGKVIELTFDDVQLEEDTSGQCYDAITIADPTPWSEFTPATFCDDGPFWPAHPIRFLSKTNQLTIHMQTDNTIEERGFSARYSQVQPRTEYIAAIGTDIASIVRIDRFSRIGFHRHLPLPGSTRPSALTFDPISAYFYYTDIQEKFIARINIKGDTHDILVDDHIDTPSGIAVAYITGLMYWADTRRNEVSVSRLDGTSRKYISLPDSGCETPRAVALSLDHRSVFWNCRRSLKRSKADGSELVVLVDGLNDVKTLQIDPYDNVLYWINALGETANLERINLNGTERQRVYSHPEFAASHGFTMDRFALFWSINASILHVERGWNSNGYITLVNDPPALEGLFYYRSDEEISARHQCAIDNGQCSELCFPEGVSFVCVGVKPLVSNCPDGVQMYTQGPQQIPWQEPTAVSRTYGVQTPVALPFRSRTHIPGSTFNLGHTTVVYIFEDDLGNEAKCSFSIELSPITTTNEDDASDAHPDCSPLYDILKNITTYNEDDNHNHNHIYATFT